MYFFVLIVVFLFLPVYRALQSQDTSKDYSKIFVVGGYGDVGDRLKEVEVIDLSSDLRNCALVANYPIQVDNMVGDLVAGRPTVCGGDLGTSATNLCFQYDHEDNQWSSLAGMSTMSVARQGHESSLINISTWLISGGRQVGNGTYDSTEVWHNRERLQGPRLPKPLTGHCQLTLNSTHLLILGGYSGYEPSRVVYLFDFAANSWVETYEMPATYFQGICGLIDNPSIGKEVVIGTGPNECYIFNLVDGVWRNGPAYPEGVTDGATMIQQNKNFIVLGGYLGDGNNAESIYEFDNLSYQWKKKSKILREPRRYFTAIAVPDTVVNCSENIPPQ